MPFTIVPTVVAGQKISAATYGNKVSAEIAELQAAVGLIRRRDSRAGVTYANGTTVLAPGLGSNLENVGGITISGTNYVVPVAGTYSLTVIGNPTADWSASSFIESTIVSGITFFMRHPLRQTSIAAAVSWTVYLAASATVEFSFINGSGGAITADFEWQVARITPPPAP